METLTTREIALIEANRHMKPSKFITKSLQAIYKKLTGIKSAGCGCSQSERDTYHKFFYEFYDNLTPQNDSTRTESNV